MAKQQLFDEQSFLIEYSNTFLKNISTNGKEAQPMAYEHLIQVTGDPTGMTNKLMNLPKMDILNNLSPAQLSLLAPMFRIYKVLRDGTRLEFPINKTPTVDDILSSLEQRGTDVGLKSFDWEDTGKSIGHGGVTRKARLVLYFQSFESLFMLRDVPNTEHKISFGDLVSTGYQESTDALGISAVDANTPFPIQIEVGWSTPSDPDNTLFSRTEIEEISNLKRTLNMSMARSGINFGETGTVTLDVDLIGRVETLMNSSNHDLFQVDESAEQAIVLRQTKDLARKKLKEKRTQLSETKKQKQELEQRISDIKEKGSSAEEGDNATAKYLEEQVSNSDKTEEKIQEEIGQIKAKLGYLKSETLQRAWKKILGKIDSISEGGNNKQGRLFYVELPKEQLDAYMNIKKITAESREQIAQISDQDLRKRKEEELVEARRGYKRELASKLSKSRVGVTSDTKFSSAVSDVYTEPGDKAKKKINDVNKELRNRRDVEKVGSTYRINFIFLGDLINAAMSIVHDRPESYDKCVNNVLGKKTPDDKNYKDTRLILGTINLFNRETGRFEPKPLGDIPISLNLFQEWWLKNVVRPQKTSYALQQFISDCLSTLVTSAISPEDLGIGRLPQGSTPQVATLTLPKGEVINRIWNERYEKRISIDDVVKYRVSKRTSKSQNTQPTSEEYLYVYTESRAPIPGIGENIFDLNERYAIPHIFAGNSRGMVKKINFKRTQIPKRLESQILNNKFGVQTNILLADKYDADIELYGSPLFINGTSIFIDPRSLGLGNTPAARIREKILRDSNNTKGTEAKIWAEEIGIGGYYDVIQVRHSLASGKFITSLQTVNTIGLNIYNSNKNSTSEKENKAVNDPIDSVPNKKKL
jgi:hypothetical protein